MDTNVVVAGLLTADSSSATARVLDAMLGGTFPFVISEELLAEYRSVLLRPRIVERHGLPESEIDERRFRMNAIISTKSKGFVENEWLGCEVRVGATVRLKITLPDPRCVMITLAQNGLPKDTTILRTLVQHNRQEVGALGSYPCAGVYAEVLSPGLLQVGDEVCID